MPYHAYAGNPRAVRCPCPGQNRHCHSTPFHAREGGGIMTSENASRSHRARTRTVDARTLKECYAMGHGVDFCTGREMVIGRCDVSAKFIDTMCRIWRTVDKSELLQGIAYQQGIEAAAARLMAERSLTND